MFIFGFSVSVYASDSEIEKSQRTGIIMNAEQSNKSGITKLASRENASINLTNMRRVINNVGLRESTSIEVNLSQPEAYNNDSRLYFTTPITAFESGQYWNLELILPNTTIKWKPVYWYKSYQGKSNVFVCDNEIWGEGYNQTIYWWVDIKGLPPGNWTLNVILGVRTMGENPVVTKTIKIHPGIDPRFMPEDGNRYRQGAYPNDYIVDNNPQGTIAWIGCALTSCCIMLHYYGIEVTPPELNNWLKLHYGYRGAAINWWAVAEFARERGVTLKAINKTEEISMLQRYICNFGPQILNTRPTKGHWVCVYGQDDQKTNWAEINDWYTYDPAFGTKGLMSSRPLNNSRGIYKGYNVWQPLKAQLFSSDWSPNADPGCKITLGSPAELLLIDSEGRRTGFDPLSGVSYNEIPGIIYSREEMENEDTGEIIDVYKYFENVDPTIKYELRVIGTGDGTYHLWVDTDQKAYKEIQSSILPNIIHNYEIQYNGNLERFEAEQMNLVNYTSADNLNASEGKFVQITSGTGTADFVYTGSSGLKNLTVRYFDTNNGNATYKLYINDVLKDSWTANKDFGYSDVGFFTRTFRYLPEVTIITGDRIKIEGVANAGETATLDEVEIALPSILTSEKVIEPTFSLVGGRYNSPQSLVISCDTPNALIHYTMDGTTPSVTSPIYSNPIAITTNVTIKAYASVNGMLDSSIVSNAYTIISNSNMVTSPTFIPKAGTYTSGQNVIIVSATEGATIHYTTDGTTPNSTSPVYTGPLAIARTSVIKAYASKSGLSDSDVATANYFIKLPVPVFSIPEGIHDSPQVLTLYSRIDGATIRYTTDGSIPNNSSPIYSEPIQITQNTIIKAFAYKTGTDNSDIATAEYHIKVAAPFFNLNEGAYDSVRTITISSDTAGATIRYTTDGSTPNSSSPIYVGPITISQPVKINTYASKTGLDDSDVISANYAIKVIAPTFSPIPVVYNTSQAVTIFCETVDAVIHYTTDGSEPNVSSPTYTQPITINKTTTIKAYAAKAGIADSDKSVAIYKIQAASPTFSPDSGKIDFGQQIIISCQTVGAIIRYTTDGNDPDASSTVYNGPITLTKNTTIKAYAAKSGIDDSDVITGIYTFSNLAAGSFVWASGSDRNSLPPSVVTDGDMTTFWTSLNSQYYKDAQWISVDLGSIQTINNVKIWWKDFFGSEYKIQVSTDQIDWIDVYSTTTGADDIDNISFSNVDARFVRIYFPATIYSGRFFSIWEIEIYNYNVVPAPIFTPVAGSYIAPQNVEITSPMGGATIRYTIDGSTPNTSSSIYAGPISVSNTTLNAYAIFEGLPDSEIATAVYSITTSPDGIINGGFESGPGVGWSESTRNNHEMIDKTISHTGTYSAHFGGYNNFQDSIEQQIAIPADGVLTYWWYYASSSSSGGYGSLSINLYQPDGTYIILQSLGFEESSSAWMQENIMLPNLAGQTAKLRYTFSTGENKGDGTNLWVDDIAIDQQLTMPTFSPTPGNYEEPQTVVIASKEGGTIYYTTDGSDPNTSSQLYTGPVNITTPTTIKAFAIKEGSFDSRIATAVYTFNVALPMFNVNSGVYSTTQTVILSCATNGATIHYTVDGKTPKNSSPVYSGPITVANTAIIKAFATKDGLADSDVVSEVFTILSSVNSVINPGFESGPSVGWSRSTKDGHECINTTRPQNGAYSLNLGSYDDAADFAKQQIAIPANAVLTYWQYMVSGESETSGYYDFLYVQLYKTDGTLLATLTTYSNTDTRNVWKPEGISLASYAGQTLVICFMSTTDVSNPSTFWIDDISINSPSMSSVATPIFNPSAGTYPGTQSVTIACTTSGATIKYTTDGTDPKTSSTAKTYGSAISVTATTTIKAYAFKSGMTNSDIASATYTIQQKVATPTFSPVAGTYTGTQRVKITCTTSGVTIKYTTDGSDPITSSTAKTYSTVISVSSSTTIKAYAYKAGMTNSSVASAIYTIR